ncbi:MAG: imidazole glycerol phosphate synthase subunit HisH, partial [Kiloniellales bacterium]|nr:imidazole glycerol phosphate synthase subunit HisH [Kiloniellales bacterium]
MTLAVVDYGSGNLRSAAKALERAAADAGVKTRVIVTPDPEVVRRAERVVLPGVGAFADCRRGLAAVAGMIEALEESVIDAGRPFLGICVGMQLMATSGREHGHHPGLGWIAGEVAPIGRQGQDLRIPHMGWNELTIVGDGHPVLEGLADGAHVYFVHGYRFRPDDRRHVKAEVDYGG